MHSECKCVRLTSVQQGRDPTSKTLVAYNILLLIGFISLPLDDRLLISLVQIMTQLRFLSPLTHLNVYQSPRETQIVTYLLNSYSSLAMFETSNLLGQMPICNLARMKCLLDVQLHRFRRIDRFITSSYLELLAGWLLQAGIPVSSTICYTRSKFLQTASPTMPIIIKTLLH